MGRKTLARPCWAGEARSYHCTRGARLFMDMLTRDMVTLALALAQALARTRRVLQTLMRRPQNPGPPLLGRGDA